MHMYKKDSYRRNYYKCDLLADSNAVTTDIRLRNICNLWDMKINTFDDLHHWLGTCARIIDPLASQIITKIKQLAQ